MSWNSSPSSKGTYGPVAASVVVVAAAAVVVVAASVGVGSWPTAAWLVYCRKPTAEWMPVFWRPCRTESAKQDNYTRTSPHPKL